jgi:hypothetical protein
MTEHDDALDELASSLLDGEAAPADRARLAGDEELQARVAQLAEVRHAVAAVRPVEPERREAAIAAALRAFEAEDGGEEEELEPPATTARRRWSARLAPALAAAAVIVLLAALVPVLLRSDDESSSFESTGAALGDVSEDDGADDGAADASAERAPTAGQRASWGDFDDLDQLEEALRAPDAAAHLPSAAPDDDQRQLLAQVAPCDEDPTASDGLDVVDVRSATVAGEPVLVVRLRSPKGPGSVARVVRPETCRLLVELDLAEP